MAKTTKNSTETTTKKDGRKWGANEKKLIKYFNKKNGTNNK
jgi:hypothetical protein